MKREDGRKSLCDNTRAEPGSVRSKGACRRRAWSWLCLSAESRPGGAGGEPFQVGITWAEASRHGNGIMTTCFELPRGWGRPIAPWASPGLLTRGRLSEGLIAEPTARPKGRGALGDQLQPRGSIRQVQGTETPSPVAVVSLDADIYRSGKVEMASDKLAKVRLPGEGADPGPLSQGWPATAL